MNVLRKISPLLYPAAILSAASLAWTTWSLIGLLGSGWIGLTVAAGADIIWASVIIAEARGLRIAGRSWTVPLIGWVALLAVAGFLAWHGLNAHSVAMAAVGPFLPLGAKVVWVLALADMRDPACLTAEQEAEINGVLRDSEYEARRHQVSLVRFQRDADAEIALIQAEARIALARDEADFTIGLERLRKRSEMERRTPLAGFSAPVPAIEANTAPNTVDDQVNTDQDDDPDDTEHANTVVLSSGNTDREQMRTAPSIADLVRQQLSTGASNSQILAAVRQRVPGAKEASVAATVRRERTRMTGTAGYL